MGVVKVADDAVVNQERAVRQARQRQQERPRQERVDGAAVAAGAGEDDPGDDQPPHAAVDGVVEGRHLVTSLK